MLSASYNAQARTEDAAKAACGLCGEWGRRRFPTRLLDLSGQEAWLLPGSLSQGIFHGLNIFADMLRRVPAVFFQQLDDCRADDSSV